MKIIFCVAFTAIAMFLVFVAVAFSTFHAVVFYYVHLLHSGDGQIGLGAMALASAAGLISAPIAGYFASRYFWRYYSENED
jgi:hypothetical protein